MKKFITIIMIVFLTVFNLFAVNPPGTVLATAQCIISLDLSMENIGKTIAGWYDTEKSSYEDLIIASNSYTNLEKAYEEKLNGTSNVPKIYAAIGTNLTATTSSKSTGAIKVSVILNPFIATGPKYIGYTVNVSKETSSGYVSNATVTAGSGATGSSLGSVKVGNTAAATITISYNIGAIHPDDNGQTGMMCVLNLGFDNLLLDRSSIEGHDNPIRISSGSSENYKSTWTFAIETI